MAANAPFQPTQSPAGQGAGGGEGPASSAASAATSTAGPAYSKSGDIHGSQYATGGTGAELNLGTGMKLSWWFVIIAFLAAIVAAWYAFTGGA